MVASCKRQSETNENQCQVIIPLENKYRLRDDKQRFLTFSIYSQHMEFRSVFWCVKYVCWEDISILQQDGVAIASNIVLYQCCYISYCRPILTAKWHFSVSVFPRVMHLIFVYVLNLCLHCCSVIIIRYLRNIYIYIIIFLPQRGLNKLKTDMSDVCIQSIHRDIDRNCISHLKVFNFTIR